MRHCSAAWLCLFVLTCSVTSCTRSSYPKAATEFASIRIRLDSAQLQFSGAASATLPDLPTAPPAIGTPPLTSRGPHLYLLAHTHRAAPAQQLGKPLASCATSAPLDRREGAARQRPSSAAASDDPFAAVALAYVILIVVGLVFLVRFIARLIIRRLKSHKSKA